MFNFFERFNKDLSKAASWGLRGWDLLLEPAQDEFGVVELLSWEACERKDLGALDVADEELVTVLVLEVDKLVLALDLSLALDLGFGLAVVKEVFLEPDERVVTPDILKSRQKVRRYEKFLKQFVMLTWNKIYCLFVSYK